MNPYYEYFKKFTQQAPINIATRITVKDNVPVEVLEVGRTPNSELPVNEITVENNQPHPEIIFAKIPKHIKTLKSVTSKISRERTSKTSSHKQQLSKKYPTLSKL